MADGIFMGRFSGDLANRNVSGGLCDACLSRNYRIVTDRRKGQSVFATLPMRGARGPAPRVGHNFITIARAKNSGM
jgi:hypothetical protein